MYDIDMERVRHTYYEAKTHEPWPSSGLCIERTHKRALHAVAAEVALQISDGLAEDARKLSAPKQKEESQTEFTIRLMRTGVLRDVVRSIHMCMPGK